MKTKFPRLILGALLLVLNTGSPVAMTLLAQPVAGEASFWDLIVGGPGGQSATWYVPPAQMTAYITGRDSADHSRVAFRNYYQFTCVNGAFQGPTVVNVAKLTPDGWAPLPEPVGSTMSGTISPEGVIDMTIDTPAQNFVVGGITNAIPAMTNYARGHMIFLAGEWRMTMQTILPENPINLSKAPYLLQWANMTKLAPGKQLPAFDPAVAGFDLRSGKWSWVLNTEWSVQDDPAQTFQIHDVVAGYFFGSSTGTNDFWVSGTIAADGSLYIVFTDMDGTIYNRCGSVAKAQPGGAWRMVYAAYPRGSNGLADFSYATLIQTNPATQNIYSTILKKNESVTGVRGYNDKQVVLTGSYLRNAAVQGMWWLGSLDSGKGKYFRVEPKFSGQTVTSSLYYGPNTALFDSSLGAGKIRIVGSYQYAQSQANILNHGLIYTGPLNGKNGNWTQIDVPATNLTEVGATVANTIPHSTMGNLVVGNFDLTTNAVSPIPLADTGNAFLYNMATAAWTIFGPTNSGTAPTGTTAYGIWQNGSNSPSYTIAGGATAYGTNTAFLVDYFSDSGQFTNLTFFTDTNASGFTHFEGITGRDGGYNLIATTANGAAFVSVDRTSNGFGPATWTPLDYPGSFITTGNTVYQDYALGIFCITGNLSLENSYITQVTPPQQELRDYPYGEVIPDTVSEGILTEHIFNSLPYGPIVPKDFAQITEQQVIDAYNLAYGSNCVGATVNGPRHWVLDNLTTLGGLTASGDELTVGDIQFGLAGQLQTAVGNPTIGSDPYVVNTVQRNTQYTFHKGLLVYELTDPDGNVYVMQSYSQQIEPSITLNNLEFLGPWDYLPSGWTYAARRLTRDLVLTANGSTQIVNDYFRNTFQINPAGKRK